jgi:ribosomal protein S18 acetylase RimI-like enzyme
MDALPKVTGLFEAHLTSSDLDRSVAFYRDVVGLPVALELPERGAAFHWIGEPGAAMLGLWTLGSMPMALSLHVALRATLDEVLGACRALRDAGVTPLSFSGEETSEPSVIGWMPAAAVYFRDPDGHQLEYLAMLDGPARPELGIVPWSQWPRAAGLRIEPYTGAREAVRWLFEEAEDSVAELDAYIGAGEVLVARSGDAVVGHVQVVGDEVKNMAVAASHRGRGIGRALLDAAVERVRARGGSTVTVATAAADVGNLRFYQRAGFRLRSIERDAFTAQTGYAAGLEVDGIALRDRVWLDLTP